MNRFEIRKGLGRNRKNRGDVGGTGVRYFVFDTQTGVNMQGFTTGACRDGGFIRKRDAETFIALLAR